LANFKDPSSDLDDLQQAMFAYEKEFSVAFKVQVPAKKPREPIVLRAPPRATIQANGIPAMSIEDLFLQKLKAESAASGEKEKPLRISNQLPLRLANLPYEPSAGRPLPSNPAPAKPTSKLGQLKSELVKEMATLPAIKAVKRPVNPLLTTTAKAPKLATHEISSDMDSQDEHMDDFRKEIAEISHTARHDQPHRSVKLISLSEVGVEVKKPISAEEDDFVPLDIAKKLQRYVLELDFEGLDDRSIEGSGAMSIPDSFEDVDHYVKVFEPLLLFECRSQLLQAKLELDSMQPFDLKVSAIASVDDFHDVTVVADCEEGQRVVAENDTIYVKLDRHNSDSKVLGIVIKSIQNGRNCEATVRLLFKPHQAHLQIQLRIGLIWHAKKLCNWITTIREYSALHSLQNFRLNKAILKPTYVPINELACETAAGILGSSLGLNHSQAQAVAVALNNTNPFTLIKGPPGTGI
jgi:senataxin